MITRLLICSYSIMSSPNTIEMVGEENYAIIYVNGKGVVLLYNDDADLEENNLKKLPFVKDLNPGDFLANSNLIRSPMNENYIFESDVLCFDFDLNEFYKFILIDQTFLKNKN